MNNLAQMWDMKHKNYPKFDPQNSEFELKILQTCEKFGINFNDKEIFEIGCGTGRYTLLLAKMAKSIDALDFSQNMLNTLIEDSQKMGFDNKIHCICEDFAQFQAQKNYDIFFAAMTPAFLGQNSYEKALKIANKFVYLGWAGKRESAIMQKIATAHDACVRIPKGADELKKWLESKKIAYKSEIFDTSWKNTLCIEDMANEEAWHLQMDNKEPNLAKIKEILAEFADENGIVVNENYVRLELIVWQIKFSF